MLEKIKKDKKMSAITTVSREISHSTSPNTEPKYPGSLLSNLEIQLVNTTTKEDLEQAQNWLEETKKHFTIPESESQTARKMIEACQKLLRNGQSLPTNVAGLYSLEPIAKLKDH